MSEMELSTELLDHLYQGGFIECKYLHQHSCNYNTWLKFKTLFRAALIFYTPIHAIPTIIFKYKALFTE